MTYNLNLDLLCKIMHLGSFKLRVQADRDSNSRAHPTPYIPVTQTRKRLRRSRPDESHSPLFSLSNFDILPIPIILQALKFNPCSPPVFHTRVVNWPRGYKTFFVLNSVEHEILNAHKCKNIKKFGLFKAQLSLECYFSRSYMLKCQQLLAF